jgi:TonB family protein
MAALTDILAKFILAVAVIPGVAQQITTISEGVAKHAAIEKPAPTISQLARQMKVSGKVEVAIKITEQGSVGTAKIVSGNPLLGESVLIAVKNWKFHPFLQNGAGVPVMTVLSFEFKQ